MKLHHDMVSHFEALKGLTNEQQTAAYLDALIGQNNKVRDIVCTGNEMLDIILNTKLTAAADAGIKVEVLRCVAPEKLPVSDAALCSLVMNMMNNALTAAGQSGGNEPYIVLDVHVKDNWFAINCKNSANVNKIEKEHKKETVPKHGLGLKIMEEIAKDHNGLFDVEYGTDYYKVSVILPL